LRLQVQKRKVLILGTGGTIAGRAQVAGDNVGYKAGEVPVAALVAPLQSAAPWVSQWEWEVRQVAQLDSKDMDTGTWCALALAAQAGLDDPGVTAVVITHGTDTLEETAFFLSQVLKGNKPVVLTCAMRPASALAPDGPQNLLDALAVATDVEAHGVCVVAAGWVHTALAVAKVHTYRVDAFDSGDSGPLACVEEGRVRWFKNNPSDWRLTHDTIEPGAISDGALQRLLAGAAWPRVELVVSHAGVGGALVDALLRPLFGAAPLAGLVVAGTGNGTVHQSLQAALLRAQAQGVAVWRTSRCRLGQVVPGLSVLWPPAVPLSPVKARIALALALAG
jgi:L-asparaginase